MYAGNDCGRCARNRWSIRAVPLWILLFMGSKGRPKRRLNRRHEGHSVALDGDLDADDEESDVLYHRPAKEKIANVSTRRLCRGNCGYNEPMSTPRIFTIQIIVLRKE